jgi:hypothetical protein
MAGFTPERRSAGRPGGWTGTERRDANRDPISGAPGAVVGGLAGKGIAEMIDPSAEEAYWRENYDTQPYYEVGYLYEDYHPAYRTGWEGRGRYEGRSFDEVERELEADYNRYRGGSRLDWGSNRIAARAAWDRFDATDPFERSQ